MLIATALTGAVAVPASAGPVAATASPATDEAIATPIIPGDLGIASRNVDKLKRTDLAKVREMKYSLVAKDEETDNEGKLTGSFKYDDRSLRSDGELTDDGPGYVQAVFIITMADGTKIKRPEGDPYKVDDDSVSTDWAISGKPKTVLVIIGKVYDPDDQTNADVKQKTYTFKF